MNKQAALDHKKSNQCKKSWNRKEKDLTYRYHISSSFNSILPNLPYCLNNYNTEFAN